MSLKGKHVLVTGSSRGIGRGIALKLAEQGAHVAINYRENAAAAHDTLALVRARGSDGFVVQADVSRPEDVQRMFKQIEGTFGTLDIFVSNALGELFTYYQAPMEVTLDQWRHALDSQATAFLVGVREAARLMPDGGRVVALTYAAGSHTGSWQPYIAQGTAKAALESLCRYFAVALARRGITVNLISPGITEDSIVNSLPQAAQDMIRDWHTNKWTPMGRPARPADIANAASLLFSDDAAWITGQTITVDGGASLMDHNFPLELQLG
jgi:NAD(P)-dependent dehydrogenase (short-subunit alcohol dehydrogenase family)